MNRDTSQTLELMHTLPALSIRQPWCWYIIRPDLEDLGARLTALERDEIKRVENRDWPCWYPARGFRGRFLIHAAKGMTQAEYEDATFFGSLRGVEHQPKPAQLERGGIVGVATVIGGVIEHRSRWFTGPYGLLLDDVEPLPFVPCKGSLGFFKPYATRVSALP